jgi:hypothetical protein
MFFGILVPIFLVLTVPVIRIPCPDWRRKLPADHADQRHQAGPHGGQGAQRQAHGEAPTGRATLTNAQFSSLESDS